MKEEVNSKGELDETFLNELKKNTFLVPDNYFNNVQDQILSVVKLEDLKKEDTFITPQDYFSNSTEQIIAQVRLSNQKEHDFVVPDNYFENLHQQISAQVKDEKTGIKQNIRILNSTILKYAAAILIVISAALTFYMNSNGVSTSDRISNIPDQEIIDYLNTYSDPNDIQFILENTDDLSLIEDKLSHL